MLKSYHMAHTQAPMESSNRMLRKRPGASSSPARGYGRSLEWRARGDVRARSNKGAMGLMQIMPGTWASLRQQHGLGEDPYDPRDNILAGAAYLRELHDRYGAAGFLAAYNAGPGRYEDHLSGQRTLPAETVDYVTKVSRRISNTTAANELMNVSDRVPARASDLFPGSNDGPKTDRPTNEKPFTARSSSDQHIVDLSALTPLSSGLFVALSSR